MASVLISLWSGSFGSRISNGSVIIHQTEMTKEASIRLLLFSLVLKQGLTQNNVEAASWSPSLWSHPRWVASQHRQMLQAHFSCPGWNWQQRKHICRHLKVEDQFLAAIIWLLLLTSIWTCMLEMVRDNPTTVVSLDWVFFSSTQLYDYFTT